MTTGELLSALLDIAGISQKHFAESMFTSPSKISKLINGNILLSIKEATDFSEQASHILAREIFDSNCHVKLQKFFPFNLNFASRHDLYQFILLAFLYAITLDKEAAHKTGSDRQKEDLHYSGTRQIQYMFCIICSDYLRRCPKQKLEFYSSIPQFSGPYAKIFGEVMVLIPPGECNITMHQLAFSPLSQSGRQKYKTDIVERIFEREEFSDLYFWQVDSESSNHIFMLQNHFALLFNQQLDGIPQMSVFRSKSQLERFNEFISSTMKKATLTSFGKDELEGFLSKDTDGYVEVRTKIRAMSELGKSMDNSDLPSAVQFFDKILEDETSIYITSDALEAFLFSRNISEKLFKSEEVSLQERLSYLKDFSRYLEEYKNNSINIIESQVFSIIVLCKGADSFICLINVPNNTLKFHIIASEVIAFELAEKTRNYAIDVSSYIKSLIRQVRKQK